MEGLMIGVTVVSLGLAVAMSIVAWRLLHGDRQRNAARVEALEALAFAKSPVEPAPPPVPQAALRATPVIADDAPGRAPLDQDEEWDRALGTLPHGPLAHSERATRHQAAPRGQAYTFAPAEEMFDNASAPGVAGRRWLAVAAIAVVLAAGIAVISVFRSPEIRAALAVSQTGTSRDARPLELLSLRHSTDPDGSFTVTGLVQNPANGRELERVEAVVYLFDDQGLSATGRAGLDVMTVEPGDESSFLVKIANPTNVSRYRVGFRRGDGRVVAHVDRRGQLPSGTTGDSIADEPEVARPAGGMHPVDGRLAR